MLTLEDYGKGFSISAIGLGLLMVFATLVKTTPKEVIQTEDMTYSMVRPTDSNSEFDLTGRDLNRTFIEGHKNKVAANKPANQDDAKAKAAAAAKKAADEKKKQANAKKKTGSLQLTDVNTRSNSTTIATNHVDTSSPANDVAPAEQGAPKKEDPVSTHSTKDDVKSASQWRALLHSQPNNTLADAFVAAHAAHEIDDGSFYQIAFELFTDTAADRSAVGLHILQKDQSMTSFVYIGKMYSKVNEGLQLKLWAILQTYSSPNKFPGLAAALNSGDSHVFQLAKQVLDIAINNVAANIQSSRDGRTVAGTASLNSFKIFIPILTRLSSSPDQSIVQIASQILARIQSFFIA
jgi:hypothetical protein